MKKILKAAFSGSAKRFVGGAVVGFGAAASSAYAADGAIDVTLILAAIASALAAATAVGAAFVAAVATIKSFKLVRQAM